MPRPGRPTTERAKNFKGTLRQLIRTMSHYKLPLTAAMLFAILSTIFNIAGPKVLAKATTALATGWIARLRGTGSIDFVYIGRILLFLLGMYLLSSAFSFIQGWLMTGLSQKVCYDFRRQISEKINRLPLAYFEKRTVGEVLSRITNDVDTLGQSLNQSITQLITSVTTMIGVLVMMLSISPRMTLIALLILPVSLALVLVVVKFSQKYFKAQQATLGVVNGQVEEIYAGHNVVKAFNREAVVLADFNAANDKLYESAWKSQFLSGLMMPIMNFVGNLGYVAVAIVGSIFAANGVITIGDIQAFIQYVKNFTQPIQQLSQVSNMLQSMAAAAERVFEFLNEPEEAQLADPARRADPADIDGQVTFDHVRFGYTPDKTVIHDFSCTVQPGQKVAIVGPTGAGKTTMVKLLMRFYDVDAGSITLNGHNVRDFDRSALREGFGMVLQDTWLFKGTIMENIRYGRLDATDEEVIAAAKAANADHFIRTLPGGYQMELNEDASNVSQGQKQLLTIARTILADNRILILDEATSSVDTRTEQQKEIDEAIANGTWGIEYTTCQKCGYHNWTRQGNVYVCDTCGNKTTTVVGPKGVKGYVGSGAIAAVAPKASAPETRYATAAEAQAAADKREAAYAAAVAAFQKQIDAQNAAYLAVAILAVADDELAEKLDKFRADTAAAIAKKDAAIAAEAAAL